MEFLLGKVLVPLALLSLVIFFHELGHFLAGKFFGFKIKVFSIGFGARLFGFKIGETDYRISLLPLGGYVQFAGEDGSDDGPVNESEKNSWFSSKPAWQRILVGFAGPFANFIKAAVCFSWLFYSLGVVVSTINVIHKVGENSPAEKAGLRRGDRIIAVNGQKVSNFETIRILVATSEGKKLDLEVARGTTKTHLTVQPELVGKNQYIIGIEPVMQRRDINGLPDAVQEGVKRTGGEIKSQVWGIGQIITGNVSAKNISGPVGILNEAGKATEIAKKIGWEYILGFLIFLNIGLGVANLLPILPLDGGLILFALIEWIRGKPLSKEVQAKVTNIGLILLLSLLIYSSFNDFTRL